MNKLELAEQLEAAAKVLRAEVEQEHKENLPPVKQWNPLSGEYWIDCDGMVMDGRNGNLAIRNFGVERQTEAQAERACTKMRQFNRLLAYVDEYAPNYEFQMGKNNWYIYVKPCGKYVEGLEESYPDLCTIYMPEDQAKELCLKLNSGEVVL